MSGTGMVCVVVEVDVGNVLPCEVLYIVNLAKGCVCSCLCVVEQTRADRYHSFVVEFVLYSEGVVRIQVVCTEGSVGGLSRDIVFLVVFGFESVVRIQVVCTEGGLSRDIVFLVVFGFESGCRSYIGGLVFVPSGRKNGCLAC